ncbi:MAG: hypothetical protein FJX72_05615 [Armatimonadetes bacterium]|nr:hypothetical protein [Armatimonadota bacterium]
MRALGAWGAPPAPAIRRFPPLWHLRRSYRRTIADVIEERAKTSRGLHTPRCVKVTVSNYTVHPPHRIRKLVIF